jgi:hypothetical protein
LTFTSHATSNTTIPAAKRAPNNKRFLRKFMKYEKIYKINKYGLVKALIFFLLQRVLQSTSMLEYIINYAHSAILIVSKEAKSFDSN